MITLVTGVPGAGKTLYAVSTILDNLKSDNPRPVFSNIDGLDYDSLKCFPLSEAQILDLRQFSDMSAIIIIDECQRFYPPRPSGSKVPEYISYFNVHRHDGLDIILITQGPKLIDRQIRDVVGEHIHFSRPFNMKKNFMYRWSSCNDDPEPSRTETNAVKTMQPLNKDVFKFYKSTVENTHSSRFPIRKLVIFGLYIFLAVLMFSLVIYSLFAKYSDSSVKEKSLQVSQLHQSAAGLPSNSQDIGIKRTEYNTNQNLKSSFNSQGFQNIKSQYDNNGDLSNNISDLEFNSELNNEITVVGFISGSENYPVLSKGYNIDDFESFYYDAFNKRFYLCFNHSCSAQIYDFELKTGKYFINIQNYFKNGFQIARR